MSSKKALIVDDSTVTRLMIRKIITDNGGSWDIHEASSADQAVSLLPNLPSLDVVTLDQNMPGEISGLDLAASLQEKYPAAKIALITANIQNAIKDKASALGIQFIEKPISPEKLQTLFAGI